MSPIKNQLLNMIDCLSEQEQILIMELVKRIIPDDIATSDDLSAIKTAKYEYKRGEMTSHDDIVWN